MKRLEVTAACLLGKKMSKVLRIALTASLLFLAAPQVQATLLTWRLENVNFDDGGTAIGFFRYDPTSPPCSFDGCIGVVPDFDITTTPGFAFPNEYRPRSAGGRAFIVFASPTGIGIGGDSGFGGTQLNLLFDESLPPEGGSARIATGSNENFVEPILDDGVISGRRQIISGNVTTIPEPGSSAFLALGGVLLMLLRRRMGVLIDNVRIRNVPEPGGPFLWRRALSAPRGLSNYPPSTWEIASWGEMSG
jgi:hypothetical protein